MIELLAYTTEDGWAYVRTDRGIFLVRPPYARSAMTQGNEYAVEKAITMHGFIGSKEEFDDWRAVTAFLNDQVVAYRNAQAQIIPQPGDAGKELLEFAPPEVLQRFLERLRDEWLSVGRWQEAQDLLLPILGLPTVTHDEALTRVSRDLLEQSMRLQRQSDKRHQELASLDIPDDRFSLVNNRYNRVELNKYKEITEQHRPLMVAV
jgi:hypothetical protein